MKTLIIVVGILVAALTEASTAAASADKPAEGTGVFGAFAASKQWTPPTDPEVVQKLQHWQDQKLGLLITWGTYSQWGIVESWSLVTTKHPWNKRPESFAKLDDRAYKQAYEKKAGSMTMLGYGPLPLAGDGVHIPAAARAKPPCAHAWVLKFSPQPGSNL